MTSTVDKHTLALWKQIIQQTACIKASWRSPPGKLHALGDALAEFMELVEFDLASKVATIRVESQPTAKAISPYLPKLESAFESVLRVDIKIRLEVSEVEIEEARTEITNQGLGSELLGAENLPPKRRAAPLEWNGLRFRSKSEMKIAQVLDQRKVLYFPNARGRLLDNYQRVNKEADFLICHEGRWGILECDGELYHQSAAKDHSRDMVWNANGIWFIKRFSSTECYNNPEKVVDLFIEMLRAFHLQTHRGSANAD
ncbi:DUF559 domain-containing protein [Chroococcidiopsis sp.]|uniref:DUF559 domain-containing protein n=1 Tax=Chroococcidiopsis sp. TaxID=3088168 RepID=UPI003F364BEE